MKPQKPYPEFPLYAHANGQWAKKIRGKTRFFGQWADWQSALAKYHREREALQAGIDPRESEDVTVFELCNRFLKSKIDLQNTGELSPRTVQSYRYTIDRIYDVFGPDRAVDSLTPDDFAKLRKTASETLAAVTLRSEILRVRGIFKFAHDYGLIKSPVRFGPQFRPPSVKTIRQERHARAARLFSASEIKTLLGLADVSMRAMILLGINCGFGQTDISNLPFSAVDGEWVDFPRPKTAIQRRCPLWAETKSAIHDAIESRPQPARPEFIELIFLTVYGNVWTHDTESGHVSDAITRKMRLLIKRAGFYRRGVGFYSLRHTFETIGQEAKDPLAVQAIMGHVPTDMGSHYRETISDERLRSVVETIHRWLF